MREIPSVEKSDGSFSERNVHEAIQGSVSMVDRLIDSDVSFPQKERAKQLEKLMMRGEISEPDAILAVIPLDEKAKAEVGMFIMKTLEPGLYWDAFNECLPDMPQEYAHEAAEFFFTNSDPTQYQISHFYRHTYGWLSDTQRAALFEGAIMLKDTKKKEVDEIQEESKKQERDYRANRKTRGQRAGKEEMTGSKKNQEEDKKNRREKKAQERRERIESYRRDKHSTSSGSEKKWHVDAEVTSTPERAAFLAPFAYPLISLPDKPEILNSPEPFYSHHDGNSVTAFKDYREQRRLYDEARRKWDRDKHRHEQEKRKKALRIRTRVSSAVTQNPEYVTYVLQSAVEYYRQLLDDDGLRDSQGRQDDTDQRIKLTNTVKGFLESRESTSAVMIQYIPQLVEVGLVNSEQATQFFSSVSDSYFSTNPFQTGDISEQIENQYEIYAAKVGKKLSDARTDWPDEIRPKRVRREIYRLDDELSRRAAHATFGKFQSYKQHLEKPVEFWSTKNRLSYALLEIEAIVPTLLELKTVMAKAREVGEEVMNTHDLSEIRALLAYRPEDSTDPKRDMEKMVVQILRQPILDYGADSITSKDIVRNIEMLESELSPKAFLKITDTINKKDPSIWLENMDYTLKAEPVKMDAILEFAVQRSPQAVINEYQNLIWQSVHSRHDNMLSTEQVRAYARAALEKNPESAVWDLKIFQELYTAEEQHEFIEHHLAQGEGEYFLYQLLNSDLSELYSAQIRETIINNPWQLKKITDYIGMERWKKIRDILGVEVFVGLIEQHPHYVHIEQLLDDKDVLLDISRRSPRGWQRILAALTRTGFSAGVATILRHTGKIIEDDRAAREKQKKGKELGYDKVYLLKHAEKQPIQRLAEASMQQLVMVCQEKPVRVFEKDVLSAIKRAGGYTLNRLQQAHLDELQSIIEVNVEAQVDRDPHLIYELSGVVNAKTYKKLLERHARVVAFTEGRYGRSFANDIETSDDLRERIFDMSPVLKVRDNDNELKQDVYLEIIEHGAGQAFHPLFEARLKKLAGREIKRNGPRTDEIDNMTLQKEFASLVKRCSLLSASEYASDNAAFIMDIENTEEQKRVMDALEYLSYFNLDDIETPLDETTYEDVMREMESRIAAHAKELFELDDDISISFDHITIRTVMAMAVYYRNDAKTDIELKQTFHDMVKQVSDPNFVSWRAWGSDTEPTAEEKPGLLREIKHDNLVPYHMTVEQYEQWVADVHVDVEEMLGTNIKDIHVGIKRIVADAVADGHIEGDVIDFDGEMHALRLQTLMEPISVWGREMRDIRKEAGRKMTPEQYRRFTETKEKLQVYRESNADEIMEAQAHVYTAKLAHISSQELETQSLDVKSKNIPLKKAFEVISEVFGKDAFVHDVERIKNTVYNARESMFGGERLSKSQLTMTDKVDADIYFRIGEEPVESCQHFDGGSYNVGIMSYAIDPAVKVIQIYDEQDTLITRSIMRLLNDENGNPAIFLERVYSTNLHEKIDKAVVNLATDKARAMGVGLYSREVAVVSEEDFGEEGYANLKSNGSRTPWIYTDAAGGSARDGQFEVTSARRIG